MTATVTAVSIREGSLMSDPVSATYTFKTADPVISPEGGVQIDAAEVSITAADDATVFYTTDGNAPDVTLSDDRTEATAGEGTLTYVQPFTLTVDTTVKALAFEPGKKLSPVTTVSYTLEAGIATISLDGTDIRIEGNNIIAGEGVDIIMLDGRLTEGRDLPAGVYVVRSCKASVKVLIK